MKNEQQEYLRKRDQQQVCLILRNLEASADSMRLDYVSHTNISLLCTHTNKQ